MTDTIAVFKIAASGPPKAASPTDRPVWDGPVVRIFDVLYRKNFSRYLP